MQTYRRFVSYVYQYENGKKAGNRGFIKVEARGNTCNMQISLKGVCRDGNGSCRVYGFKREEGLLKGSLLAVCPVRAGLVQEQLGFLRNEMGEAGYSLHDLNGVIFKGDDETMYGTQWDDAPMKMENFQPDEKNARRTKNTEDIERQDKTVWERQQEMPVPESTETDTSRSNVDGLENILPESASVDIPERDLPENAGVDIPERILPENAGVDIMERGVSENVQPEYVERGASENVQLEYVERGASENVQPEYVERGASENVQPEYVERGASESIQPEYVGRDASENIQSEYVEGNAPERIQPEEVERGVPGGVPEGVQPENVEGNGADGIERGNAGTAETGRPGDVSEPGGEIHIQEELVTADLPENAVWTGEQPDVEAAEEREGRRMPPKDPGMPAANGMISGEMSAELPERGLMEEQSEPQERSYMQEKPNLPEGPEEAGAADRWDEGEGLPEILDTTVAIPDREEDFHDTIGDSGVGDDAMEDSTIGEDAVGEDMAEYGDAQVSAAEHTADDVPEVEAEGNTFTPFTDGVLSDCQRISIEDLKFLDPRDQGMRNNRFVQHGYQMFGHLLLARVARNSQYILGVPGMYQKQERFMADMFGFHNFKCARRKGSRPACFGYWYRLIYPPKLD